MQTIDNFIDLPKRDLTIYLLKDSTPEITVTNHLQQLPRVAEFQIRIGRSNGRRKSDVLVAQNGSNV